MRKRSSSAAFHAGLATAFLLVACGPARAQVSGDSLPPLSPFTHRALARAVMSVQASAGQVVAPPDDWRKVSRLEPGADVHIVLNGRGTLERRHVRAEGDGLVVFNAGALPNKPRQETMTLLRQHPNLFDDLAAGQRYVRNGIGLGPDGIRDGSGHVVATLEDLVERLPADAIQEISIPAENARRLWGIVGLTLMASATAVNAIHSRRVCHCPDVVITPAGAGLFAGSLFAMLASSQYPKVERGTRTVIFRRR